MPTTVKTGDLLDSIDALRELAAIHVPVKLGMKLQRILKKVQTEIDGALEEKKKLLDRHAEKDADGKQAHPLDAVGKPITTQVKLKDPDAYVAELKELHDAEITLGVDRINPAEFDRAPSSKSEPIEISTGTLLSLSWLLTEE